jgi:hypothetical protein
MTPRGTDEGTSAAVNSPGRSRIIAWLVLSVLVALLAWFGFSAYLSPELLFHFSNSFYC